MPPSRAPKASKKPAKKPAKKDVHERALGLLAVRARSRRELERRLSQAGFGPEEVAAEMDRLDAVGLIDDESFARQLAEHAFGSRLQGRRAVVSALASKGVAPAIVAAVVEDVGADEEARALELAMSRASRLQDLEPGKALRRLQGLLVRRGYGSEVARRSAHAALGVSRMDE